MIATKSTLLIAATALVTLVSAESATYRAALLARSQADAVAARALPAINARAPAQLPELSKRLTEEEKRRQRAAQQKHALKKGADIVVGQGAHTYTVNVAKPPNRQHRVSAPQNNKGFLSVPGTSKRSLQARARYAELQRRNGEKKPSAMKGGRAAAAAAKAAQAAKDAENAAKDAERAKVMAKYNEDKAASKSMRKGGLLSAGGHVPHPDGIAHARRDSVAMRALEEDWEMDLD